MRPDQQLIEDFHNGVCTPEQARIVLEWMMTHEEMSKMGQDWDALPATGNYPEGMPTEMMAVIRAKTFGDAMNVNMKAAGDAAATEKEEGNAARTEKTPMIGIIEKENAPVTRAIPLTGTITLIRNIPWKRWAVAASVVLIAGIGMLGYGLSKWKTSEGRAPVLGAAEGSGNKRPAVSSPWKLLQAGATAPYAVQLADGSNVVLAPGAVLRYDPTQYNIHDRTLFLEGQARFTVANDKTRPFSVIANGFSTTALGTSFMVATEAGRYIRVRLYSGKVVIHQTAAERMTGAMRDSTTGKTGMTAISTMPGRIRGTVADLRIKDVYLQPGQEMVYDPHDPHADRPVVSRFEQVKARQLLAKRTRRDIRVSGDTLVFDNAPLVDVLTLLQKRYGVIIRYDPAVLSDAYFTGQVLPGDAIELILKTVTRMNKLTLMTAADDTFVIK